MKEAKNLPYEKAQDSVSCEQQLAEIWNERSKIFSDYDKVKIII